MTKYLRMWCDFFYANIGQDAFLMFMHDSYFEKERFSYSQIDTWCSLRVFHYNFMLDNTCYLHEKRVLLNFMS